MSLVLEKRLKNKQNLSWDNYDLWKKIQPLLQHKIKTIAGAEKIWEVMATMDGGDIRKPSGGIVHLKATVAREGMGLTLDNKKQWGLLF